MKIQLILFGWNCDIIYSGRLVLYKHHQNWANRREENFACFSLDQQTCTAIDKHNFYAVQLFINLYLLLFLKNSGFVEIANIKSYLQHRAKYVDKGKSKGFRFKDAVQKADEFLMDPIVNMHFSYFRIDIARFNLVDRTF